MKRFIYGFLVCVFFTGLSCVAAAEVRPLVIAGTGDSQMILRQLARQYEKLYPGTRILVPDSVGSGGGIKALLGGTAEFARTARPLKEKEQGKGLVQILFAKSPVVFAAHPSVSDIKGLAMTQAVQIFSGDIVNWQILGGANHKLYAVNREQGDSSRKVITAYLSGVAGVHMTLGDAGKIVFTTPAAIQAIGWNPFSIGFVPLSSAQAAELHILALDGVLPTDATVGDGTYPLVTPFYLVHSMGVSEAGKAFLSFIKTREAHQVMRSAGVFPAE